MRSSTPSSLAGFSRAVNFEPRLRLLPLCVLLCAGAALSRVAPPAEPMQGSRLATLAADWSWLRANAAWEAGDESHTRAWSAAAVAAAPQTDYFRLNAARMRAFDFAAWREARDPAAPESVRARWRRELADEALVLLLTPPAPGPARWIEAGNIALYCTRDVAAAAEYYRRAAELPGAPWHAGRIYGELLRQSGRSREAVAWLKVWLARLPADDPAAQRELVAARIAELERELGREREAL